MRLHFQNLSDDRRGRTVGSIFRNGRAWLYLGDDGPTVRWSWHFKSRDRLVHLHANNAEHGLHSSIAGLGVFLSFGIDLPWKWLPEWWHELTERQLGISDHDGSLWFDFFAEQDRSPSRGPFGIRLDPLTFRCRRRSTPPRWKSSSRNGGARAGSRSGCSARRSRLRAAFRSPVKARSRGTAARMRPSH